MVYLWFMALLLSSFFTSIQCFIFILRCARRDGLFLSGYSLEIRININWRKCATNRKLLAVSKEERFHLKAAEESIEERFKPTEWSSLLNDKVALFNSIKTCSMIFSRKTTNIFKAIKDSSKKKNLVRKDLEFWK